MRLAIAVLLVACGSGPREPPASPRRAADAWQPQKPPIDGPAVVAKQREMTRAICACGNNDCIARAVDERNRWAQQMKSTHDMTSPGSYGPAEKAQAEALLEEFKTCAARTFEDDSSTRARDEYLARRELLRDRMCSCTDRICGETVAREVVAANRQYGHVRLNAEQGARLKALQSDTMACAFKAARGASKPP